MEQGDRLSQVLTITTTYGHIRSIASRWKLNLKLRTLACSGSPAGEWPLLYFMPVLGSPVVSTSLLLTTFVDFSQPVTGSFGSPEKFGSRIPNLLIIPVNISKANEERRSLLFLLPPPIL